MRSTRGVLLAVAVVLTGGCGTGGSGAGGQTGFVSRPPGGAGANADGATAGATGGAAPATPATASPAPTAREIVEGDLYALSGTTLHVLNAYRGLQLVDVSDPARPRLRSRVAVTGTPVELYVQDGVALFTVSEGWGWGVLAAGAPLAPTVGSQLWAVDVRDPGAPAVLATVPLEGSLLTTRVVGHVLYVVTRTFTWGWLAGGIEPVGAGGGAGGVVSVGGVAAAPAGGARPDVVTVASFDLSDPRAPGEVAHVEVPLQGVGWDAHAYVTTERVVLAVSGYGPDGPGTRFLAFDVSDPGGRVAAGPEWTAPGSLRDRWSMDQAGTVFRAALADGWNGGATVRTWTAPLTGDVVPLGAVSVGAGEGLTAARFDGDRAYVVTAVRTDPLWVIDVSDAAKPLVLGSLTMPGQLDFVEPRGSRLVALGHTSEAGAPWQLHASVFDVGGPPRLLARQTFGGAYGWVATSTDDVRKAFQVLDAEGLVLVPFGGVDPATWEWRGGTQLLDLDLAAGTLVARGFVPHPGIVSRAFPLPGRPGLLAAFSDERLQLVDASDRSAPRELAAIDLARPVWDLAVAGASLVELCGTAWRGEGNLAIASKDDADAATPLARVELGAPASRIFQSGAITWALEQDPRSGATALEAIDVSDPAAPRRRGAVAISSADDPGGWYEAALSPAAPVLALERYRWDGRAPGVQLALVDLSDPDAPRVASRLELGGSFGSDLRWSGASLWFTRYEWTGASGWVRFFLERVDAADPAAPVRHPAVNVPGALLAASPDGSRVHTLETTWDDASPAEVRTVVHALDVAGDRAVLRGSVAIDGGAWAAVARDGFAYLVPGSWRDGAPRSRLVAVDLGALRVASEQPIEGAWAWPFGVAGQNLLLRVDAPAPGVLVYDLAAPGRPAAGGFTRTKGWAWSFADDGERAFLPGGPYGVSVIPLAR